MIILIVAGIACLWAILITHIAIRSATNISELQVERKKSFDYFYDRIHKFEIKQLECVTADGMTRLNELMLTSIKNIKKEVDATQDHCAKLRDSQLHLQETLASKRPLLKIPPGPFQVEIFTPSKKMGKASVKKHV